MDSAQWIQDIRVEKSMVDVANNVSCVRPPSVTERKPRPQKDHAIDCPRCHSTNTKFCYYNNYSLTQPRYFCKNCRRYWTEGGTLRNVPVGGGSRKNKRSSLSNAPSSLSMSTASSSLPLQSHKLLDLNPPNVSEFSSDLQNPKNHQGQDLNLGYPAQNDYHNGIPQFFEFPKMFETRDIMNSTSSSNTSSSTTPSLSALNLLRNGIGLNSLIPLSQGNLETNALFTSNFPFNQECKPAIGFSFDGVNGGRLYANPNVSQENATTNGSLGFPFGSGKRNVGEGDEGSKEQENNSNGYWNGMLGGGSW